MYFVSEQEHYMADNMINIEVAYALPERQSLLAVSVAEGSSVKQGIEASGILQSHIDIKLTENAVGIFGKRVADIEQYILKDGDRVEIYRPLQADPKEVRRRRAEKAAANKKP